jgi:Uma2 family endonuclease
MTTTVLERPTVTAPPIPADDGLYEIVNGERVELPPMSIFAARIGSQIGAKVEHFGETHNLGVMVIEGLFRLRLPQERNRRPDVAFVSYQRWAKDQPVPEEANAWDVVPDLAVEVVSPTDIAEDLMEKIGEYFQANVRLVWLVYPRQRIVHVYEALTKIRVLLRGDELDGGAVLPGFRLPLATLFPEPPASP